MELFSDFVHPLSSIFEFVNRHGFQYPVLIFVLYI